MISRKMSFRRPKRWLAQDKDGLYTPPFYISKITPTCSLDKVTRRWIRNANDERAAQEAGCRFSESAGDYTINWVTSSCYLYEGDKAGQLMDINDWQYEWFKQVYGWMIFDEERDEWVRRFNQATAWIAKKNAKSPTLASNGLYLLSADGELGQHCYSLARDAGQARIAHNHAINMVDQMPYELRQDYKINNTTGLITHLPTRSTYSIVAGQNIKSTEGFNGSTLTDETHVVDEKLIESVKRAGISRKEPLRIEMSTAGDTAEGYGRDRYFYGLNVQKGEIYAPRYYFLDFSVDNTNTTIDDYNDEEKVRQFVRRANPTLGRIVRETEAMEDYKESRQKITNLIKFAQHRTNLWTSSGADWIATSDWSDCQLEYSIHDLVDYDCVAGLDLSKTRDMTALSVIFGVPIDDAINRFGWKQPKEFDHELVPFSVTDHWLPRNTARQYQRNIDFRPWEPKYIEIFEGKVISYSAIMERLAWLYDNFTLRAVGYDPYNSDVIVSRLETEYGWGDDMLVSVPQRMGVMGPVSKEFERLVLSESFIHPPNPLLDWQFGHCKCERDKQGNVRPVKPDKDSYQKVDGIVSLVIATCMYYYDDAGLVSGGLPGVQGIGEEAEEDETYANIN